MNVIFVSNLTPLEMNATSTDITTDGLINGLIENNFNLTLVLFTNVITKEYEKFVKDKYWKYTDKIYILKSGIGENRNKYAYLAKLYFNYLNKNKNYFEVIKEIKHIINNDTILLSHSPSLESIFFCQQVKNQIKNVNWIQYWSDPITLSGITPELYSFKRVPYKILEKLCFRGANEIVYGPKTLCYYQKNLFKKYRNIMRGVDLFYINHNLNQNHACYQKNRFLYAGNYYKYTRNIIPLFDAFNDLGNNYELDVYGEGDQFPKTTKNLNIYGRLSPENFKDIELSYKNVFCLMNHRCIQIPGKIFYNMNTNQNIYVVVDGKNNERLTKYLKSYNRFILVENDKEKIKNILNNNITVKYDKELIEKNYSSKKIIKDILNLR